MDYDGLSDEVLLAQIGLHDARALAALYDRYAAAVLAVAMVVLGNSAAAETIVVETFWAIWQGKGTIPIDGRSVRNRLMLFTRYLAQRLGVGERSRGEREQWKLS